MNLQTDSDCTENHRDIVAQRTTEKIKPLCNSVLFYPKMVLKILSVAIIDIWKNHPFKAACLGNLVMGD